MSVKKDPSGRRSVQVEVEVPATPEQVWQAIATGPGISCWFVPTEVEEREGGAIAFHLGAGMDSTGTVTGWEPPRRFAYEERDWMPNAPPIATEMTLETRGGGVCIVRLVHSLFATSDGWDTQLESMETGWPGFFRILQLYLKHFQGRRSSIVQTMASFAGSEPEAWRTLTRSLGLSDATPGQRRVASAGAPKLAGIVEGLGAGKHPHVWLLRLDQPAPGLASLGAYSWAGKVHVAISLYLYGEEGSVAKGREGPSWQTWLKQLFPDTANQELS